MNKLHEDYLKNAAIPEIIAKLKNETLVSFDIEHSGGLDGFMSALYNICIKTNSDDGVTERLLIAKFMKGDTNFRETSKSYIQFANEVYIYGKVLPEYRKLLAEVNVNTVSVDNWVAPVFMAKFGYIEGLSSTPDERESILILENLKPFGYTLGPRLYLNQDHLLSMCKPLGEYHALSYALRICNKPMFDNLRSGIKELPFINDRDPDDSKYNLYRVLYAVGFNRFFDFIDRSKETNILDANKEEDRNFISKLHRLRELYYSEPTRLLEKLRTDVESSENDRNFAVILHGDYNRNNVLFRYKVNESENNASEIKEVDDVKMIDFQELRYGSPALDLSFFMYMNSPDNIRADGWMDILKEYHTHMFQTLSSILMAHIIDEEEREEQLKLYSYENFLNHFSRYAFCGAMICIHFLPWMLCSEDECERISKLFETDMHGEEFWKLSFETGGDNMNLKNLETIKHAFHMGYMDFIQ